MQLTSLLPAAALAWSATANAFLLPPDVKGEALEAFQAIPDTANHWTAHIACDGCPVAQDKEDDSSPRGFVHAAELKSDLVLDFATNDNNEITLGGVTVYPPMAVPQAGFTAKQVLNDGGDGMVTATEDDLRISSRVDFNKEQKDEEQGVTITPFMFEILGVEDQVVHADIVTFDILRDSEGHVYISNPETRPSPLSPADAACTSVFCRVRVQLLEKIAAAKAKVGAFAGSCMRKMGFKNHGHGHDAAKVAAEIENKIEDKIQETKDRVEAIKNKLHGGPEKFRGKFGKKPCPGKFGKHGHHHGAFARIVHGFRIFTQHVLMPILIGVAAGMAVSAFGMLVGQIVFMIWTRVKGRRQNMVAVYHIIEDSDVEAALDEEALPKYEEKEGLPAYTDEKTEI